MSQFQSPLGPKEITVSAKTLAAIIGGAVLIFIIVVGGSQATEVVQPGHRGVKVTLGKVSPMFLNEGFVLKLPFITTVEQISVRQQTDEVATECYSSDLQQVNATMRVLFRVPERSVVQLYQNFEIARGQRGAQSYESSAFRALVLPRVIEALKEAASTQSAEEIVQNREAIKQQTLETTQQKIGEATDGGPLIEIVDITLSDLTLSAELNAAIEQKMTQKEEAERAKFVQRQAEIEAETAIIKAKGEAESIQIRGKSLRENPAFIKLQIVEKWSGTSPLVVGGGESDGADILVPMNDLERNPR